MSTQLKTRPPESRTDEAPTKPRETIVISPAPVTAPPRTNVWYLLIIGVVVIGLTVAALVALTNDTTSDAPSYVPAFDSPGGNSLVVPAAATDAYIPVFDSPGGNSLNLEAIDTGGYVLPDGPGGHSLNIP